MIMMMTMMMIAANIYWMAMCKITIKYNVYLLYISPAMNLLPTRNINPTLTYIHLPRYHIVISCINKTELHFLYPLQHVFHPVVNITIYKYKSCSIIPGSFARVIKSSWVLPSNTKTLLNFLPTILSQLQWSGHYLSTALSPQPPLTYLLTSTDLR